MGCFFSEGSVGASRLRFGLCLLLCSLADTPASSSVLLLGLLLLRRPIGDSKLGRARLSPSCSLASSLVSCKARPSRSRRVRGVEASVAGGLSYCLLSCYTSQPQPAMQLLTSRLKYPWIEEGRIGSRVGHDAYVGELVGPGMLVDQQLIQARRI